MKPLTALLPGPAVGIFDLLGVAANLKKECS